MCQVNIFEAKTELSKLIALVETGKEDEVVIARNGKPVVSLVLYRNSPVEKRIGAAKGLFVLPVNFEQRDAEMNHEAAKLFGVL